MSVALPLDKLIEKFREVHGISYDYSLVDLKNKNSGKIKIICPTHGEFSSNHSEHKMGTGCKLCGYERNKKLFSKIFIKDLDDLEKQYKEKFGDLIDFSSAIYKNNNSRLDLLCKKHNIHFRNTAYHIVRGAGCGECRKEKIHCAADTKRLGNKEFIGRSQKIHNNRYDYSLVEYKSLTDVVRIICSDHGIFLQKPREHFRGSGCKMCSENPYSSVALEWLSSLRIENLDIEYRIDYNDKWYFVDGFDPGTNTVYEFYGDYWHGNPRTTDPHKINSKAGRAFKELYENTMIRENNIKNLGYNFVSIWEDEYNAK